jgi:solute carrier family 35 protein E3
MWHFTCTAVVLWIACHRPFHLFQPIRLPVVKMLPLCSFFAGFLILNNLSLTSNSVGFYQLAKIMTTPCVVLFSFLLFRKTITLEAGLSLASLCFGVALTNHNAASSNPLGAAIAVAAFATTAMYQIWISKKIKDFAVTSPQLLMNQAPISVFLLAFFVPAFDTVIDLRTVPSYTLATLLFSGLVASLLNLSQFLIIGRTSPLTVSSMSRLMLK